MNQLCGVCVIAVVHDQYGRLSKVSPDGLETGPIGNMTVRAGVMREYAMTDVPEDLGFFRDLSNGYEYHVFAVTVVGMEPRCAMHVHMEGDKWRHH